MHSFVLDAKEREREISPSDMVLTSGSSEFT